MKVSLEGCYHEWGSAVAVTGLHSSATVEERMGNIQMPMW